jgi:hypothetical protein
MKERIRQDLRDGQDIFYFSGRKVKASSLFSVGFKYSRKRDCLSLFLPERVKTINPKHPVDPVKSNFSFGPFRGIPHTTSSTGGF